jgi:putative tricarboxylic transport membrane protein
MHRADIGSGLFWLALGLFVAYSGWELELGSLHDPGSGFLLFWVGLIMAGLSLAVLLPAVRVYDAGRPALFGGFAWRRVVIVVVSLVVYAYAFEPLGFLISTALLMIFLFKAVEPQSWTVAIAGGVAGSVIAYVLFHRWLGAQLPAGILGIG